MNPSSLPNKRYRVILADPPWPYYGNPHKPQAAGKHYTLMSLEEIGGLPVSRLWTKRDGAACFLWCPCPKVEVGFQVLRCWGFIPRGIAFVWVKTRKDGTIIHGQGTRPTAVKPTVEMVLYGASCARGRPLPVLDESVGQVIPAPRGRHSEKPKEVHRRIERLYGDVPRIELFARERESGWDAWGDEL